MSAVALARAAAPAPAEAAGSATPRPLSLQARFALGGADEAPFLLPPSLLPADFETLAIAAHRSGVADIRLQTDDYIWFSLRKRWRRASVRRLTESELAGLVPAVAGSNAVPLLAGGTEKNTRYEVTPPDMRGARYGFRLNAVSTRMGSFTHGHRLTLRVIREEPPSLDELKVPADLRAALYQRGGGMSWVVGATGHGKTSLLAATARQILVTDGDAAVLTFENPIEFVLAGLPCKGPKPSQCQVGTHIDSFVAGAVNVMRSASQVVIFGETRTADEARGVIDCALSGHVTYSTLHAETVSEVFPRLINLFSASEQAAIANKLLDSCRLLVAQKLVRTLDLGVEAVREWIALDRPLRQRLGAEPPERWSALLRAEVEARGTSMESAARALLQAGRIDRSTYLEAAGIVGCEA